jgi:hypothetical protein
LGAWSDFAASDPDLASFGEGRFKDAEVAYLATVRDDGSPRVHPVTPIIAQGRLFLFTGPASPKGRDLRRHGHYALHSLVTDQNGTGDEFTVRGAARLQKDAESRGIASAAAPYSCEDSYILFELSVEGASSTVYNGVVPVRRHWGKR